MFSKTDSIKVPYKSIGPQGTLHYTPEYFIACGNTHIGGNDYGVTLTEEHIFHLLLLIHIDILFTKKKFSVRAIL